LGRSWHLDSYWRRLQLRLHNQNRAYRTTARTMPEWIRTCFGQSLTPRALSMSTEPMWWGLVTLALGSTSTGGTPSCALAIQTCLQEMPLRVTNWTQMVSAWTLQAVRPLQAEPER